MAFLYNLDNSVAAHSWNLAIVTLFSGATFDVEHRSSQDVLFRRSECRGSLDWLDHLSQNPCS